jgi:Holliday junction resolvase RusA-like endonuclease
VNGEAVPLLPGQTCLDDVLGTIDAAPATYTVPTTAPRLVQFHALGVPVPQGSKKAFKHRHTGRVVMTDDNPNLAAWRDTVAYAARAAWAGRAPLTAPVTASLVFYLPRPASHYGTGRNAGILKASAPLHPTVKPDLDKLVRAVFDSLTTAGVWKDDALCWGESAWKNYADGRPPGLVLTLEWGADG